jgi:hypothetical protein
LQGKIDAYDNVDWFAPAKLERNDVAILGGYIRKPKPVENSEDPKVPAPPPEPDALRELVVYKRNSAVQIFNVVEHGRRFYRSMIYCSDSSWSFHDLPLLDKEPISKFGFHCALDLKDERNHDVVAGVRESLIVSRNLGASEEDTQMFIPHRFLIGLLPAAILDHYDFWQNPDDSLTGYPRKSFSSSSEYGGQNPYSIHVDFVNKEGGEARVSRRLLNVSKGDNGDLAFENRLLADGSDLKGDSDKNEMFLLNLMTAIEGTVLGQVAKFLQRVEDLSHCLVWTRSKVNTGGQQCSIDLLELPRLGITFNSRLDDSGKFRLFSNDHVGMYVSNEKSESISKLTRGLPHCVLLESLDGDMGLMVPGHPPVRFQKKDSIFIFDRRDRTWLENMQVRHYYYPVHLSSSFLFCSSLSSSLYLLLFRFLSQDYEDVFRIAESCVSDTNLSAEELQIVQKFAMQELTSLNHPDAHACRLKLSLVNAESSDIMSYPWSVENELTSYIQKHSGVSIQCRFTISEESLLLSICHDSSLEILNRRTFVTSYMSGSNRAKVTTPKFPTLDPEFSLFVVDESVFEPFLESFFQKLRRVSYKAPPQVSGPDLIPIINNWLRNGIEISGGKDDLGFLFFYELMTGSLRLQILPGDSTFELATLLIRLMKPSEFQGKNILLSILRILMNNPQLASNQSIPKVIDDPKKNSLFKMTTMFMASENAFSKLMKELQPFFVDNKAQISWPKPRAPIDMKAVSEIPLDIPSEKFLHRSCLAPRVANYSCSQRVLAPFVSGKLGISDKEILAFSSMPLLPIQLDNYLQRLNRDQMGYEQVPNKLPFDVSRHPYAATNLASNMLRRLKNDAELYASDKNNGAYYRIHHLSDDNIASYVKEPQGNTNLKKVIDLLLDLKDKMSKLCAFDMKFMASSMKYVVDAANYLGTFEAKPEDYERDNKDLRTRLAFGLLRYSRVECNIWFEHLVASLLSSKAEEEIQLLNPFLSIDKVQRTLEMCVVCLLHANRIGQVRRCLLLVDSLLSVLQKLHSGSLKASNVKQEESLVRVISTRAEVLAQNITAERHYMKRNGNEVRFDPRLLVFEFAQNILLRKSQVEMIDMFIENVNDPKRSAMCQQMIMGSGKTT